jgi:hypothetical protein
MSDVVSFTEPDSHHVELLPARTVQSMFTQGLLPPSTPGGFFGFLSFLQGNSYGAPGANASGAPGV